LSVVGKRLKDKVLHHYFTYPGEIKMIQLTYVSRKSTAFWKVMQDGLVEGTDVSQCAISMCRAAVLTCPEDGCTILTTCNNVRSHSCSMGKVYTSIGEYTSSWTKMIMKYTCMLVIAK
jgi:hypothetical protein